MENNNLNEVYGGALYEASADLKRTEEFRSVLADLKGVFTESPKFFELLKTPALSAKQRRDSARAVFKGNIPDEILNFLYVLIDKRRIGQFTGIVNAFERRADRAEGVTKGRVVSAAPITDEQLKRFEKQTGQLMKINVALEPQVDPSLIGGARVYVEGKLIDASIRKKLDDMKEQLKSKGSY